jgi:HK97 family phage prohead protease
MKALKEEFGERLVTLSTGKPGLRSHLKVKVSIPTDAEGDCIDMKASDETLDRYEEVIRADGWDLTNYNLNPVVQNSHQYGDILFTIGKALRTEVQDGALVQRWQFATDVNPIAKIAYGLYKGGYLNASSVGFIPLEWTNGNKVGEPSRTYTKSELLEVSAVSIPANPNALVMGLKSGAIAQGDLKEMAALLKQFCNEKSDLPGPDSATAGRFHVAQLLLTTQSVLRGLKPTRH